MTERPHVVILGAGPAGLGAAFQLSRLGNARVTILEQKGSVGGNAGSFDIDGIRVDYGSHRLHPACDPEVLDDIRSLLGEDFLDRPRHGRIRLQGRWVHFPLQFSDLLVHLSPRFLLGVAGDKFRRLFHVQGTHNRETFATVLEEGLGRTICQDFYFPYAKKLWGLDPDQLAATQAKRRVSAASVWKILRKILLAIPGISPPGTGRFFYPRQHYGQISEAYAAAAVRMGAELILNSRVVAVQTEGGRVRSVQFEKEGKTQTVEADHIWSTIPLTILTKCIQPQAPSEIIDAAERIYFRAMILIYLVLDQDRFGPYDAHYFPEKEILISRLSEPSNYTDTRSSMGRTILCAELPCNPEEDVWSKSDDELRDLVVNVMEQCEIPIKAPILKTVTRRLKQAYPVYHMDYAKYFDRMDRWLNGLEGFLTFGRQGLFVHDNTHHALYMAYAAAKCLGDNGFDRTKWGEFRQIFESHVVED